MASGYEHRPASPAALARAERSGALVRPGGWALDVGGGPGTHAACWARSGVHAVVLDPSPEMCRRAGTVSGVRAVQGTSQALPFRTRMFDLVYFHLSIHYGNWTTALDEATRVLASSGSLEIWTLGARHHESSNLARWFPSVAGIDSGRFPDPEEIATYLDQLGLVVERSEETEVVERRVGSWIDAVRGRFVSTLQLLSPEELEAGLAAFRRAYPDPDEHFCYELRYDRAGARRPPLLLLDEPGEQME